MRLGAQADSALVYDNQPGRAISRIRRIGRDVRFIVPYEKVQAGGWSPFQQAVHEARSRHLRVQVALSTPAGLNRYAYAQFAAQAARQLRGVRQWSPVNEPESQYAGLTPAQYRSRYDLARRVIGRRVHGARFELGDTSGYGGFDYLQGILNAGRRPLVADGYAIHPYQFETPPEQRPGRPDYYVGIGNIGALQRQLRTAARRGQLVNGRGGKVPLDITEFGYQRQGSRAIPDATRERWIPRAIRQARRHGVRSMYWYGVVPTPWAAWNTGLEWRDVRAIRAAR